MPHRATSLNALSVFGVAAAAIALGLCLNAAPASAAPLVMSQPVASASIVMPAQVFKRGRPPIYPYVYRRGRPGGWDFYFGPVPYAKGDYETQALQRVYPQLNYPPSMRYWTPQSQF